MTAVPHFSSRPHPTPRMVPQLASKTGIKNQLQKGSQKDSLVYFFKLFTTKLGKYCILNQYLLNLDKLLKRENAGSEQTAQRTGVPGPHSEPSPGEQPLRPSAWFSLFLINSTSFPFLGYFTHQLLQQLFIFPLGPN